MDNYTEWYRAGFYGLNAPPIENVDGMMGWKDGVGDRYERQQQDPLYLTSSYWIDPDDGMIYGNYEPGHLPCDGSIVKIEDYPKLYEVLGNKFGGDESTLATPDLRGKIVDRGVSNENIRSA